MRRLLRPARVFGSLLVLSFAQYALGFMFITRGELRFYSPGEHAVLLGYGAICYAACRVCDRVLGARRWSALLASYPVAALGTSGLFVAARALVGGATSWSMVAANVPPTLLMFHAVVSGAYFAVRHIDAVAAHAAAERAAAHAELRRLQHQVDPHFLFNNLNILAALIRQAPEQAEQFTHHLARLYRYLMQHNQLEWVELDDEIRFVESYLHLLSARFGLAYRATLALPRGSPHFVVPGVLQELLGNVVKHNHASAEQPVDVELRIDGDSLISDSALRPKRGGEPAGHGLSLLSERYRLQTGRPVEWFARGGRFVVKVPLVSAP